jgi:hypothetical protein
MKHRMPIPPSKFKILYPGFIAVIFIAFFLRFYRLADYPLGVFFDPAINGLDALRLWQRGGPVIFFPTNGGREALFMYGLMAAIRLFGTIPLTMRLITASAGLLTVAMVVGFLRDPHTRPNARLALPAGLALATMYWHVAVSRLGQRPILVPLVAVLLFWLFLKGWGTGRRGWFIGAGLALGLSSHIYSAARLLPVILGLSLLPELWQQRQAWRQWGVNLLWFSLATLAVFAPMGWYMLNHPAQFAARAGTVIVWHFLHTPADIAAELGRNALRVAGFFCCAGSPNPIFGLPGYPGLSPLLAPFLLLGLLACAARGREFWPRLMLLWWVIGIAPSIAAIEAPHPWRMVTALPATAILVAAGLLAAVDRLALRLPAWRKALYPLALLLILAPGPGMFRAYFGEWGNLPAMRGVYDYSAVAIRSEVLKHTGADIAVYLPQSRFNDSTLLYYLGGYFWRHAALTAASVEQAIVIAPQAAFDDVAWVRLYRNTATVLPPLTPAGRQVITAALRGANARPVATINGDTAAWQAPLPTDPAQWVQQPNYPAQAAFGPVSLTGAAYDGVIAPQAGSLPVTFFWQATAQTTDEYEIIVHLVDDQRRVWGNGTARPTDWVYPTTFWRPGLDHVAAQHRVAIETPPPPGRYWLAVAVFNPATGQRLPLTAKAGDSPDTRFIGPLKMALPPAPLPALAPAQAGFGDMVALTGFAVNPANPAPGQSIRLTLLWTTHTTPPQDYTVFVHLLDAADNLAVGQDMQPVNGSYPTSLWSPGEQVLDVHTLPLPTTLASGPYRLAVGLYHQPSGQRLPLQLPNIPPDPGGRLVLPLTLNIAGR